MLVAGFRSIPSKVKRTKVQNLTNECKRKSSYKYKIG